MKNSQNDKLAAEWQQRWQGSEQAERLTFLGKMMFKAKKKVILQAIEGLETATILEVGCGLGHTLKVYHDAGLNAEGIDASQSAVNVCLQKGFSASLKKLSDVNDSYDLISSDGMLEHFLNFEPYAEDMMRISKRFVLLIQPNHQSLTGKTLVYFAEILRGHENVFEYNYRISDFVDVFARHGFRNIKNMPIFNNIFRLLLFEKSIEQ